MIWYWRRNGCHAVGRYLNGMGALRRSVLAHSVWHVGGFGFNMPGGLSKDDAPPWGTSLLPQIRTQQYKPEHYIPHRVMSNDLGLLRCGTQIGFYLNLLRTMRIRRAMYLRVHSP